MSENGGEVDDPDSFDDATHAVYGQLVADRSMSVEKLQARLGLGRSAVDAALEHLGKAGLVEWDGPGTSIARINAPDTVVAAAVETQLMHVAAAVNHFRNITKHSVRLSRTYRMANHARVGRDGYRIETSSGVAARIQEFAGCAVQSVESLMRYAPTDAMLEGSKQLEAACAARGVRLRAIYPASLRGCSALMEHGAWSARHGGQIRSTTRVVATQYVLFDRSNALIEVDSSDGAEPAVIVTSAAGFVKSLAMLFDILWEDGAALERQERSPSDYALSTMELQVLKLMNDGHKDEAVARHLGISTRTVRRILAALSERLGADSRFALGAGAVRAGLI